MPITFSPGLFSCCCCAGKQLRRRWTRGTTVEWTERGEGAAHRRREKNAEAPRLVRVDPAVDVQEESKKRRIIRMVTEIRARKSPNTNTHSHYTCIHMCIHKHARTNAERERERKRARGGDEDTMVGRHTHNEAPDPVCPVQGSFIGLCKGASTCLVRTLLRTGQTINDTFTGAARRLESTQKFKLSRGSTSLKIRALLLHRRRHSHQPQSASAVLPVSLSLSERER